MIVTVTGGERFVIREIRPSDKELLREGFSHLSPETIHRRFLSPKHKLSGAELRYLTEVDGHDHHAIVALPADDLGALVGVARFVRSAEDPETAEAAIVVGDAYQGRGLGKELALRLADAAREHGVRRFSAEMLSDNPAALALMRTLDRHLEAGAHEHGVRSLVAQIAA